MEPPILNDPTVYPTQEIVMLHLGRATPSFLSFFEYHHKNHPEFIERWNYYRDGTSWLMNISCKKKTICWISIGKKFFRVSFYFHSKAEHAILNSDLPGHVKEFYQASAGKKFRPITIVIKAKNDLAVYKKLLSLKLMFL